MKKHIKWYFKVLIVFGSLIGAVLVFCVGVILYGTCFKSYKESENPGKNWMSRLDDNSLLCETKIPGSHDSCTYSMLWLGETQNLNIDQQLECGVRYFDIRVNRVQDDYVIYHGPLNGVRFDPIIDSIATFISSNPTETLLLDFQHFDNGAQDYVFETVTNKLLPYVVKNETSKSDLQFVSELKTSDVRGKCVVFFGYGAYANENYIFERNNDDCSKTGCSLDSCYYTERNSADSKTYIEEHIPYYVDRIKQKKINEGFRGFSVLQCQLTDSALIFGPYSKEKSHDKNMSEYISKLPEKDFFNDLNIIMRDFVNTEKVSQIYNLNFVD